MKMKANCRKRSLANALKSYAVSRHSESPKRKRVTSSPPDKRKKIYSFDDLTEVMKPSEEELRYREKECKNIDAIEKYSKLFRCTKCHMSYNSIIENHEKVSTHPCLQVLMCQDCCDYYLDGEFSVDSEGEEKYCRWCGEGGVILGCSLCVCGFCAKCIRKHWDNEYLKKVKKNDNWICFFCNPKPLWKHRLICSLAVAASKNENTPKLSLQLSHSKENVENSVNSVSSDQSSSTDDYVLESIAKRKRRISRTLKIYSSSDELVETPETSLKEMKVSVGSSTSESNKDEKDPMELKNTDALIELGKILKLSGNHMDFGKAWTTKMLKKFTDPGYSVTSKNLVAECQKIKQFLSLMSTYLVQFSNSIDSVERSLQNDFEPKNSSFVESDRSSFNTILQFLDFVNSQVKIFIEKGITLSDIFDPEVYDYGDVVGIKKKSTSSNIHSNKNGNIESEKASDNISSDGDGDSEKTGANSDVENDEKIKMEISPEIISSQNTEGNLTEGSDEQNPSCNVNLIPEVKTVDPKQEIQEILAILENA